MEESLKPIFMEMEERCNSLRSIIIEEKCNRLGPIIMVEKFSIMFFRCLVALIFILPIYFVIFSDRKTIKLHPVIFVPGDGGSRVEGKLNRNETVHFFCEKKSNSWFMLWLNLELLAPYVMDCFIDNIRLVYDNVTRTTSNVPGVDIRIPGFGSSSFVEILDPSYFTVGSYFLKIATSLLSIGYVRDVSMRGAPYDFRKAPNELGDFFTNFTALIEETYELNEQTKVVLVSHSMGSLMCLHLLQNQPQSWKNKYIQSFVSLAGPWGGSVKAVKVFACGDNLGVFALSASTLKEYMITCPSSSWLLPSENLWAPDEILVQRPEKNYTMANLKEFFVDMNYIQGWQMREDVQHIALDMRPPGVELHCLYGTHVSTPGRLVYAPGKFPGSPHFIMDDGDGTVNIRSLKACHGWENQQGHSIYYKEFPSVDHMKILEDENVLDYFIKLLKIKG